MLSAAAPPPARAPAGARAHRAGCTWGQGPGKRRRRSHLRVLWAPRAADRTLASTSPVQPQPERTGSKAHAATTPVPAGWACSVPSEEIRDDSTKEPGTGRAPGGAGGSLGDLPWQLAASARTRLPPRRTRRRVQMRAPPEPRAERTLRKRKAVSSSPGNPTLPSIHPTGTPPHRAGKVLGACALEPRIPLETQWKPHASLQSF